MHPEMRGRLERLFTDLTDMSPAPCFCSTLRRLWAGLLLSSCSGNHQLTATALAGVYVEVRGECGPAEVAPGLQAAGVLGQVDRQLVRPARKGLVTVQTVPPTSVILLSCQTAGCAGRTLN